MGTGTNQTGNRDKAHTHTLDRLETGYRQMEDIGKNSSEFKFGLVLGQTYPRRSLCFHSLM